MLRSAQPHQTYTVAVCCVYIGHLGCLLQNEYLSTRCPPEKRPVTMGKPCEASLNCIKHLSEAQLSIVQVSGYVPKQAFRDTKPLARRKLRNQLPWSTLPSTAGQCSRRRSSPGKGARILISVFTLRNTSQGGSFCVSSALVFDSALNIPLRKTAKWEQLSRRSILATQRD